MKEIKVKYSILVMIILTSVILTSCSSTKQSYNLIEQNGIELKKSSEKSHDDERWPNQVLCDSSKEFIEYSNIEIRIVVRRFKSGIYEYYYKKDKSSYKKMLKTSKINSLASFFVNGFGGVFLVSNNDQHSKEIVVASCVGLNTILGGYNTLFANSIELSILHERIVHWRKGMNMADYWLSLPSYSKTEKRRIQSYLNSFWLEVPGYSESEQE